MMRYSSLQQPLQTTDEQEDLFRQRMLVQMLMVEQYRHEQQTKFGRSLSRDEAASEWIDQFAEQFARVSYPNAFTEESCG